MADGAFGLSKELARETAPVWAKVKDHVTPIEWPAQAALISEINQLKREREAVILAHGRKRLVNRTDTDSPEPSPPIWPPSKIPVPSGSQ